MKRDKMQDLIAWKGNKNRKPLIVRGARQVGKTWIVKEFGRTQYQNMAYVNFENAPELANLFKQDLNPKRIISALSTYLGININSNNTLIFFDEIQSVEGGLASLKYFCEDVPEYHVIAAGSLLGIALHSGTSFPVGKVDFIDIKPLTFFEFLNAVGQESYVSAILSRDWETVSILHSRLCDLLKVYFFVGGMPEAVQTYVDTKDLSKVEHVHQNILYSYQADFSKHAPFEIIPRLNLVWNSIPAQLGKENKKFVYGIIRQGARAKDYEMAIYWLLDCGLLSKCCRVSKPSIPLKAYENFSVFKLFLVDIGLLSTLSHLDSKIMIDGDSVFTEFKGAMTEQFVMQELMVAHHDSTYYWTNEKSTAEIDFLVQGNADVFPIEAKAGINVHAKSFKMFCEKYKVKNAYRFSLLQYKEQDWMTNVPLYAAGII
jgi:uncharacterized protein